MNKVAQVDPKKLRKRIRDRNYRFRKMKPAQQRITIAKDVIDQLRAGKITARTGVYLIPLDSLPAAEEAADLKEMIEDAPYGHELPEVERKLEKIGKTQVCDMLEGVECKVCGIGAAFVAAVRRADDLTLHEFIAEQDAFDTRENPLYRDSVMRKYLRRYFSARDVALIECAFEENDRHAIHEGIEPSHPDVQSAVLFGENFDTDEDRLIAIMQNIIDNGGRFRP